MGDKQLRGVGSLGVNTLYLYSIIFDIDGLMTALNVLSVFTVMTWQIWLLWPQGGGRSSKRSSTWCPLGTVMYRSTIQI